jgi:hypothetical protein
LIAHAGFVPFHSIESVVVCGLKYNYISNPTLQSTQILPPARKRELLLDTLSENAWQRLLGLKTKLYHALVREHRPLFDHTEMVLRRLADRYTLYLLSNTLAAEGARIVLESLDQLVALLCPRIPE